MNCSTKLCKFLHPTLQIDCRATEILIHFLRMRNMRALYLQCGRL